MGRALHLALLLALLESGQFGSVVDISTPHFILEKKVNPSRESFHGSYANRFEMRAGHIPHPTEKTGAIHE